MFDDDDDDDDEAVGPSVSVSASWNASLTQLNWTAEFSVQPSFVPWRF